MIIHIIPHLYGFCFVHTMQSGYEYRWRCEKVILASSTAELAMITI